MARRKRTKKQVKAGMKKARQMMKRSGKLTWYDPSTGGYYTEDGRVR